MRQPQRGAFRNGSRISWAKSTTRMASGGEAVTVSSKGPFADRGPVRSRESPKARAASSTWETVSLRPRPARVGFPVITRSRERPGGSDSLRCVKHRAANAPLPMNQRRVIGRRPRACASWSGSSPA